MTHKMKFKVKSIFVAAVLSASGCGAHAQDGLNNILRASTNARPTFAVFDVRPGTASVDALEDAVSGAFKKHYDGIKAMRHMAPYPLPAGAPRMTFHQSGSAVGTISVPDCAGASAVITSSDHTMQKYGETSVLQGCIFPYRDGYRVNVYALFVQKSGGADVNVLGAMLGRMVTRAIGLGDSGKFINETIDDIEARLKAIAPQVALVELQPSRADKTIAADPAPTAQPVPLAAADAASNASMQGMPPELAAVQARLVTAFRQQQATAAGDGDGDARLALQARKDLSAMGLSYFSQEQFVEAARRGDQMACELFVRAASAKANAPDKAGVTPLQAAKSAELKSFLLASVR